MYYTIWDILTLKKFVDLNSKLTHVLYFTWHPSYKVPKASSHISLSLVLLESWQGAHNSHVEVCRTLDIEGKPPCSCPESGGYSLVEKKEMEKLFSYTASQPFPWNCTIKTPEALKPHGAVHPNSRGLSIIWVFSASSFIVKLSVISVSIG